MVNDSKESSVLFSLKELVLLEEERRADEAADEVRRADLALRAVAAEEQRRHDEREAQRRDEEARARAEDQRIRDEAAHAAAIREAAVERARREADGAVRVEEMRVRLAHESQLATLAAGRKERRVRRVALGMVGFGAALIGLCGFYATREVRTAEVALARERQVVSERDLEKEKLDQVVELQRRELTALETALHEAQRPISPEATVRIEERANHPPPRATRTPRPISPKLQACDEGDPLCKTLP